MRYGLAVGEEYRDVLGNRRAREGEVQSNVPAGENEHDRKASASRSSLLPGQRLVVADVLLRGPEGNPERAAQYRGQVLERVAHVHDFPVDQCSHEPVGAEDEITRTDIAVH